MFDAHAVPWALERLTTGWPVEDVQDLIDRLSVLYDTLQPPPKG